MSDIEEHVWDKTTTGVMVRPTGHSNGWMWAGKEEKNILKSHNWKKIVHMHGAFHSWACETCGERMSSGAYYMYYNPILNCVDVVMDKSCG